MRLQALCRSRAIGGVSSIAVGLASIVFSAAVSATPARTTLAPGSDIAAISPASLRSPDAFVIHTPDGGRFEFQGAPANTPHGGVTLNARSKDGRARLYAYSVGERLVGAELYRAHTSYRLVTVSGQLYWEPLPKAASIGALLAEPAPSKRLVRKADAAPPRATPGADGTYEVTALALYSQAVESDFGAASTVVAEIDRLIALTNAIYTFNQVPVRVRLTSIERFDDAATTDDFYESRDQLATDPFVVARRNATESDLVLLFRAPGGLCGLSSGFNGMHPTGEPDHVDPDLDAFNVISLATRDSCGSLVTPHEIGHSLSAGHEYATSAVGVVIVNGSPAPHAYWKPYAHALPCLGETTAGFFSMMWGIGVASVDEPGSRTDVITNPRALLAEGRPCGLEGVPGVPPSQADNVRAMTDAAPYVAAYRGSSAPTPPGTNGGGGGAGAWGALLIFVAMRLRSTFGARHPRRRSAKF